MSKINKDHVGTSFDDFLTENKMLDEVATLSNKHIIAMQI